MNNVKNTETHKLPISIGHKNDKFTNKWNKKYLSIKNILVFFLFILGICITNYILNIQIKKAFSYSEEQINSKFNLNGTNNTQNLNEISISPVKEEPTEKIIKTNLERLNIFLNFILIFLLIILFLNFFMLYIFYNYSTKNQNKKELNKKNPNQASIKIESDELLSNELILLKDKRKNLITFYKKLKKIKIYFLKFTLFSLAIQSIFQFILLKFFMISAFSVKDLIYVFPYFHCLIIFMFIYYVSFDYFMNFLGFLLGLILFLFYIENDDIKLILDQQGISNFNLTFECYALFCGLIIVIFLNYNVNSKDKIKIENYENIILELIITKDTLENLNLGYISLGENMQINYNKSFSHVFTSLLNKQIKNQYKCENTLSFLKTLKLDNHLTHITQKSQTSKFIQNKFIKKIRHYSVPQIFNKASPFKKSSSNLDSQITNNAMIFHKSPSLKKSRLNSAFQISNNAATFQKPNLSEDYGKYNENIDIQEKSCNMNNHHQIDLEKESANLFTLLMFFDKRSVELNPDLNFEIKNIVEEFLLLNIEEVMIIEHIFKCQIENSSNQIKEINKNTFDFHLEQINNKLKSETRKNIINDQSLNISSKVNIDSHKEKINSSASIFKEKSCNDDKINKIDLSSNKDLINDNSNNNIIFINKKDSYESSSKNHTLNNKSEMKHQEEKFKLIETQNEGKNVMKESFSYMKNDNSMSNNFNDSHTDFLNWNNYAFKYRKIEDKYKNNIETSYYSGMDKNYFQNVNSNGADVSNSIKHFTQCFPQSNFDSAFSEPVINSMKNSNLNISDCNLNLYLLSFLSKKKFYFKQLLNIMKIKYSETEQFFKFFTFQKKFEKEEINDLIYLEFFIRYNKFSNKIEFSIRDYSHIINIVHSKAEENIKKMFLNKLSNEFRNPILNIIQLIKNLKHKISENKTNAIITRRNHKNLKENYFVNNTKETFIRTNKKSSLDNSDISEKTRLLTNVEFNSFSIFKEILEKENFFKPNILPDNSNCSNEMNSNSEISNNGAEVNCSNSDLEKMYLQRLKRFSIIMKNENNNNYLPTTDRNNKNVLFDTKFNKIENELDDNKAYQQEKDNIKLEMLNSDSTNKNLIKSNSINDIYNRRFSTFTTLTANQNFPRQDKLNNSKLNQEEIPFTADLNNLIKININALEENLETLNNQILLDLNSVKYICRNLNLIMNDFEFFTKIDTILHNNLFANNNESNNIKVNNYENNDISQIAKTIITKFDIRKQIKKLIKMFKSIILLNGKKITLNLDLDKNIPNKIKSSSEKINQILFNLLSNSLKFTKIGLINLKVRYETIDSKLIFNISDSGTGIKKEFLNQIFKPYSKLNDDNTNIHGFGLGLYVVKLHIDSLNGYIQVESKENQYTSFNFYIKTENSNSILNDISNKSKEFISNSTILFKAPSIKSSEDNIDKSMLMSNTSKNLSLKYINQDEKKKTHRTNKFIENSEAEESSVMENESYEDNLYSTVIQLRPFEKSKIISNAKIKNVSKINYQKNNNNALVKSSKTYNKNFLNEDNSMSEKPILNILRSNSHEISAKQLSFAFKKAFNFDLARKCYYQILKAYNKSSPNNINKNYRLFINHEEAKVDLNTSINSNLFIENSYDKGDKDFNYFTENNRFTRKLSKFSIKNDISKLKSIRKDSHNMIKENANIINKNNDCPIQKEIDSNSFIEEIEFKKWIKNSNIYPEKNKTAKNNRNEFNSLNKTNSMKTNNENQTEKINDEINIPQLKGYYNTTDSRKTIPFEESFNFNYEAIFSGDMIKTDLCLAKSFESDRKSNNIYLNNSHKNLANINLNNPNPLCQSPSFDNIEQKESPNKTSNNKQDSNFDLVYSIPHKQTSNLIRSKSQENNKLMDNLISEKVYFKNKNNVSFIPYLKSTNKIRILVVDDEQLIRQSNINLITKFFKNKNINYEVYECEDGFECLNYIYQARLVGINFNYIITDQTMNFISGTLLSDILGLLVENRLIDKIKIFFVTSYSANLFDRKKFRFDYIFTKPFRIEHLELMFKGIIKE